MWKVPDQSLSAGVQHTWETPHRLVKVHSKPSLIQLGQADARQASVKVHGVLLFLAAKQVQEAKVLQHRATRIHTEGLMGCC